MQTCRITTQNPAETLLTTTVAGFDWAVGELGTIGRERSRSGVVDTVT